MKQIKWVFLIYALAAVLSMSGIGIAVAERSLTGILVSSGAFIVIMGMGFKTKRKMQKDGIL